MVLALAWWRFKLIATYPKRYLFLICKVIEMLQNVSFVSIIWKKWRTY